MSKEPMTEKLPCDHCGQLIPPERFQAHEVTITSQIFDSFQLILFAFFTVKLSK